MWALGLAPGENWGPGPGPGPTWAGPGPDPSVSGLARTHLGPVLAQTHLAWPRQMHLALLLLALGLGPIAVGSCLSRSGAVLQGPDPLWIWAQGPDPLWIWAQGPRSIMDLGPVCIAMPWATFIFSCCRPANPVKKTNENVLFWDAGAALYSKDRILPQVKKYLGVPSQHGSN